MIGVCIGASTVSFVRAGKKEDGSAEVLEELSIAHNGEPKDIFIENLKKFNPGFQPVVVTGRKFRELVNLPTISEPEATEHALNYINKERKRYTAIASIGGETFIVYTLDDQNRISNVITGNKCASGTGEFFMQQIRRMNLSIDDAVKVARGQKPFRVSGRCSVFCKSDCTHALNKGTPIGEVAAGLSEMIADKVEELLRKARQDRVLVVGGTSRNDIVMEFLRKKVPNIEIPKEATYFEAMGAALYGLEHDIKAVSSFDNIFIYRESSFDFHESLKKFEDKVQFKQMERGKACDGDRCIVGLDVGSTTTKAIVMRLSDNKILGGVYLRTNGNPVKASRECYAELARQIPEKIEIIGLGTTGSGRHIAGLHALTDGVINEIIAHATAAAYFDPEVDTIFEIGGQDAKYTYLVNKVPADYAMNEACSAGTGSFLEEAARESLDIDVTEIADIAIKGKRPPNFNDQCAAFISSDIKTAFQENIPREDIVAGLVYSICVNYINRVKGPRKVGNKIFMQGGVCYNRAVPIAMAAITNSEIIVPPEPGLIGAYGLALEVKDRIQMGLMKEKHFNLQELADREVMYGKSFICQGGKEKCDRKCEINMITVGSETHPFGGACAKYYNIMHKVNVDAEKFDYVKKRYDLTFHKYAPPIELPADAKSVGINQSLHTHTIYPLYYNFFTQLGLKVIMSQEAKQEGTDREQSAFCYPVQLSLGLFQDLMDRNPDYVFVPNIVEMFVHRQKYHRLNANATCVFVNSEPYYLRQAFKDYDLGEKRMITTTLNFAYGFETQEAQFVEIAKNVGVTDEGKARRAYQYAVKQQYQYMKEMNAMAESFLAELEANPDAFAIILFGRPYNTFTDIANKGIPQKFASRGIYVVPYDMFDYHDMYVNPDMYFEMGKKILKMAGFVKKHPQLFGTYVTNFLCGPDSFIVQQFRDIMKTKPSLTLELDGHTADAGVTTRVEAALDIIRNYRSIAHRIKDPDYKDYRPARIELGNTAAYFITSEGERLPLTHPDVIVVTPSMNDLATELLAAAMRSLGISAFGMPEPGPEVIKKARSVVSGKECLPLQLCVGHLIEYLDRYWDGKKKVAFLVNKQFMNCRIGMYHIFLSDYIAKRRLKNVAIIALDNDNNYAGLGPMFSVKAWQSILTSDVLDDMRSGIRANAQDPEHGMKIFNEEFKKLLEGTEKNRFYKTLRSMVKRIHDEVPVRVPIEESKYIAMCGEVYVRRDGFSHKWLDERFAKKGFIVKKGHLSEWIWYLEYLLREKVIKTDLNLRGKIELVIRRLYMPYSEKKIKKIIAKSGYYQYSKADIAPLIEHGKHIISREFIGEPCMTVGIGMLETVEHLCGVINIGPFGCMPVRLTEAIMTPEMRIANKKATRRRNTPTYDLPLDFKDEMSIPFLTIESDGNVYPQVIEARLETFAMQAERMYRLMKKHETYKHYTVH